MNEEIRCALASASATVLAAAAALPVRDGLAAELAAVEAAAARGYFLPDEDEWIKLRYSQYLTLRASLLATIAEAGSLAGGGGLQWGARLPLFAAAFAAACILMRATRFIVDLASRQPVLWKKLDEADMAAGIPRKSFTTIYKALSSPRNQLRFIGAADFFHHNRAGISALAQDPALRPLIELLEGEAAFIEQRRREAVKRRLSYRWFSFLRRHRSAWKQVMGGFFEVSGRAIADLHQPGVKAPGASKRIHEALRAEILAVARPGDVFVTRHDDALSNWFLPGYWPHAALFLGDQGAPQAPAACDWFLEAKKDGVKIRAAAETLAVDALIVLRPPLTEDGLQMGVRRALSHCGKPYDFLFDFRTADRLVCTEVVYRGYHGIDPIRFHLRETGGRLCLPAEEFLDQALACGFQLVLTAGLEGDRMLTGPAAQSAFRASRGTGSSGS
jgi:hypothetical protein